MTSFLKKGEITIKRITAVFLAVSVILSCSVVAFASNGYKCVCGYDEAKNYDELWCHEGNCIKYQLEHAEDSKYKCECGCGFAEDDYVAFCYHIVGCTAHYVGNEYYEGCKVYEKEHQRIDGELHCTCGLSFAAKNYPAYCMHIADCSSYNYDAAFKAGLIADSEETCPYCGNVFHNESQFNSHIKICYDQRANGMDQFNYSPNATSTDSGAFQGSNWGTYDKLVNLSVADLIADAIEFARIDATRWPSIAKIAIRLIDFTENMATLVSEKDSDEITDLIDSLEAEFDKMDLDKEEKEHACGLIEALREKAKTAGCIIEEKADETTSEEFEETSAVISVATGSAPAGIAVFAIVSSACAAAYVCIKKKK